jgi:hypothetical protein
MHNYERRLQRLEQSLPRWPSEIEQAKQRCLARLHIRIGEACSIREHPLVVKAQTELMDDTPAQAEHDRETLRRWARQHPATLYPDDGAWARITAKLEEMAQRIQAGKEGA